MLPLRETIYTLKDRHWLVGKTVGLNEILKVWIYLEGGRYSLFVSATGKDRTPRRNAIGRDFDSIEEVLETLFELDAVYQVTREQLFFMLTSVRPAAPEEVLLLEEQLVQAPMRAARNIAV